jgi:hypothetical protein
MRLGGGSSSVATDRQGVGAGSGVALRSGTAATVGDASRSVGSSDASGLAETVKRQRQCEPAETWLSALGSRLSVGPEPRLVV